MLTTQTQGTLSTLSASAPMPGRSSSLASPPRVTSACKFLRSRMSSLGWSLTESNSANSTVESSSDRVDQGALASIPKGQDLPPAPIDSTVDKWFFISGAAV